MKKLNTRRLDNLSKATHGVRNRVKSDPSSVVLGPVLWPPHLPAFSQHVRLLSDTLAT